MTARLVALEGIDQSGKKTQTMLLVRRLTREGYKVSTIGFPIYTSPSGREIRAFLEGRRSYSPRALHMLYSLNRWENSDLIARHLERSDFLIADRYTASNLAYGTARGLGLKWLTNLDAGLPEPDVVVVLDVPVPASFSRKRKGRDVHESDRTLLLRVIKEYRRLALKFHWKIVNGTGTATAVHAEVWKALGGLL